MSGTASDAVKKIKSWHGYSESNGKTQKYIMDPYNKLMGCHLSVKKTAWCAITIVVMLWKSGVPLKKICKSAGCTQQMKWFKKKKRWEARGVTPKVGWIVFYHFKQKNGKRKSVPGHVGTVTSVNSKTGYMVVEEGNKSNRVGTRKIKFKSLDVLGFGIPFYK